MTNILWTIAISAAIETTTASAAPPYALTRYDDSVLEQTCYADIAPYHAHFDGAVTDGAWGLCGFSDRNQKAGEGSLLHNSVLYHNVDGAWKFSHKGNGYFTAAELEEVGVPADIAQPLIKKFLLGVCLKGSIPGTAYYCVGR